ncbi:hypothetical protein CALVIDRAFT_567188 [Calocera viscosa TUFC12733]|uniref:DUF6533 domain-containing protein n=1 Tax=Calocera viscosa (strain TUFC12733) TaxID=1330018 RepID=A0A167IJG5_CALVF|nr:hypothetical protein CALVIDRAFT_567188 [Calocera viscosa TUFC12733]
MDPADVMLAAQASAYVSGAGLVIVIYDILLTTSSEIRLIWGASRSVAKCLYLYNRYTVPVALIINGYMMTGFATPVSAENLYSICFETLIVLLIVARTWWKRRGIRRTADVMHVPLTDVLLRDGLIYYCTMVLLLVAGLIDYTVAPDPYSMVGIYFLWSMHATLVSRIYLHLRDVSTHVDWTVHTDLRPKYLCPTALFLPSPYLSPRTWSEQSGIHNEVHSVLDIARSPLAPSPRDIEIALPEPEADSPLQAPRLAWDAEDSRWWSETTFGQMWRSRNGSRADTFASGSFRLSRNHSRIDTLAAPWSSQTQLPIPLSRLPSRNASRTSTSMLQQREGEQGAVNDCEIGRAL